MSRSSNEYMRKYMAERYKRRLDEAIKRLGGVCVKCGTTENLEFDHIDPLTKAFDITKYLAGCSEARYENEIKKCQLLCTSCHIQKSVTERGQKLAKGTHGTLSAYRYCKCSVCVLYHSTYLKEHKKTRAVSTAVNAPAS